MKRSSFFALCLGFLAALVLPIDPAPKVNSAAKSPECTKRMNDLGDDIMGGTAAQIATQIAAKIQDEVKRWGPLAKAAGAKVGG